MSNTDRRYLRDRLGSRQGSILMGELPEEYRYRDRETVVVSEMPDGTQAEEFGDLEAFLHGFGHVLDLIRGTIEQAHADAFAEASDNGRSIQPWLVPYLAELVGGELVAADPDRREAELNHTVGWYKSKGTLANLDSIADVVSAFETVVREGWRDLLVTPRVDLPPFSVQHAPDHNAAEHARVTGGGGAPLGTVDLRYIDQPVQDPDGFNPLYRLRFRDRTEGIKPAEAVAIQYRSRHLAGTPLVPHSYADMCPRTPDLRDETLPGSAPLGPHQARVRVHVAPPEGLVGERLLVAEKLTAARLHAERHGAALGPADLVPEDSPVPARVIAPVGGRGDGKVTLQAGHIVFLEDLVIPGEIRIKPGAQLNLHRCAVGRVVIEDPSDTPQTPALVARDSLMGSVTGFSHGFAELIYCTILGETDLMRLQASDCIFNGPIENISCSGGESCIRFSAVPSFDSLQGCKADKSDTNTLSRPVFVPRFHKDSVPPRTRRLPQVPVFGIRGVNVPGPRDTDPIGSVIDRQMVGAGVLSLATPRAIREGAEDGGEMGCHHHQYHTASIRAAEQKLKSFLRLGQSVSLAYDPLMALHPPTVRDPG